MIKKKTHYLQEVTIIFVVSIILFLGGCDQYEYYSPMPGFSKILLQSTYSTEFIDTLFRLNNFTLRVTSISAIRSDGAIANIYRDPKAIGPTRALHNVLGEAAYYGTEVIGIYPIPPGIYNGLQMLVEPADTVVLDGYRKPGVERPADYSSFVSMPKQFEVVENQTTEIVINADVQCMLVKLAYTFQYRPCLTIKTTRILNK